MQIIASIDRLALPVTHLPAEPWPTKKPAHSPNAGGFVPYASYRMAGAIALETLRPLQGVLDGFRSFYFDTALSSSPAALPSLLAFAKPGHVLFGSDRPFAPSSGVGLLAGMLDAHAGLDDAGHAAINRPSAERLFPQCAS